MTVISPTGSLGFGYAPQRRVDFTSAGVRWAMIFDPSTAGGRMRLLASSNLGANWSSRYFWDPLTGDGSIFIDHADNLHLVYADSAGRGWYRLGRLSANHMDVTWVHSGSGVPLGTGYVNAAVVGWVSGSTPRAMVVGSDASGRVNWAQVSTLGSSWGMISGSLGLSNNPTPRPALDLVHNGDGKTPVGSQPSYWLSYTSGLSTFARRGVGTGWSSGRRLVDNTSLVRAAVFDGARFIVAVPDGAGNIDIYERNATDTETTERTIAFPDGTIIDLDVACDVNGDLHVGAVGDGHDPMIIRFDRSTATWDSNWTTLASVTTGGAITLARRAFGHQLDVVYRDDDEAVHVIGAQLNQAPTQPTWNATPAVWDASDDLEAAWTHHDGDGDPQAAFKLRRVIDNVTTWWDGADWDSSEQWVESSEQEVTVPGGWASDGEMAVFTVWTRDDPAEDDSPASDEWHVFASTRVNPTLTAPTDGQVLDTALVDVEWTVDEQSAYRLRLLSESGAEVQSTGWIVSASTRTGVFSGLLNTTDYTVELTTRNDDGLESLPVTATISVLYTPPPIPEVEAFGDAALGAIVVSWTTPDAVGVQPPVTHCDLLRVEGEGDEIRVASGRAATDEFVDRAVRHETVYGYIVVAFAADGQQQRSDITHVNLLTRHQSNVENADLDVAGFVAGDNTTLARDTALPIEGAASLKLTADDTGTLEVSTVPVNVKFGPSYIGTVTIRDLGARVEARLIGRQWDDEGNLLAETPSAWLAQEPTDVAPPPATETLSLRWSSSPLRTSPALLNNAALTGSVYVFLWGSANGLQPAGVTSVEWKVDGVAHRTDTVAPWDLAGGSLQSAAPFDTAALSPGQHTITAEVTRAAESGGNVVVSAVVRVVGVIPAPTINSIFSTGTAEGPATGTVTFTMPTYPEVLRAGIVIDGALVHVIDTNGNGAQTTHTFTGLTTGQSHVVYLLSITPDGRESGPSEVKPLNPTFSGGGGTEPPPPEPPAGLIFGHVTGAELTAWRGRVTAGTPYVAKETVGSNVYPGDWNAIVSNKNKVAANVAIARWTGPTSNNPGGCINNQADQNRNGPTDPRYRPPVDEASWFRDAAFWCLVDGGSTAVTLAGQLADELLVQASQPGIQFEAGRYCAMMGDQGPMWPMASWVTKLAYAYWYLLTLEEDAEVVLFSTSERVALEAWFDAGMRWFWTGVKSKFDTAFSGWQAGDEDAAWGLKDTGGRGVRPYDGGPILTGTQIRLNNRLARTLRAVGVLAEVTRNLEYRGHARRAAKGFVKYYYSGAGWMGDFERGSGANPWQGLKYAQETWGALLTVADIQARHGDTSLYEWSTTVGDTLTAGNHVESGGPKSLWTGAWDLAAYDFDGGYLRNIGGNRIRTHIDRVDDINLLPGNYYGILNDKYGAEDVHDTFMRTKAGTRALPSNPTFGQDTPPDHGTYPERAMFLFEGTNVNAWGA